MDPPCSEASFEVNSKPHTGARPSVRLCVGLMKSLSHQKMGRERYFYEGRQRTEETERQPRIVIDLIHCMHGSLNWYQVRVS
jgi:hypothetical protein